MVNDAVISMPDKWEYPWFAAWDLAFHTIALSTVDIDFAEGQLELMLKSFYLHPTGQIPAYEWNFGDVNPPVHAWAAIFLHRTEQALGRDPDLAFLARVFAKLSLNFTWWTNRKDRFGKNFTRAASWASTTSASSTAARPCRPEAISNRPTGRPGWRCSVRTCSNSAWS